MTKTVEIMQDRNGNYIPNSFPEGIKEKYGARPLVEKAHSTYGTGAKREKLNNTRYDYFPFQPVIESYSRVAAFGAMKYDDDNWYKGLPMSQLFASAMRHGWAFMWGEDKDKESGLCHLDHFLWNVVAMVTFKAEHRMDDRFSNRLNESES